MKDEALTRYGWSDAWTDRFRPYASAGCEPGRVLVRHRAALLVATASGEREAVVPGRLQHAAASPADLPAVGDWVALEPAAPHDAAPIRAVLPRSSVFSRKVAGRVADEQIVAANVDTVLIVTSLDCDFNARRLERYLMLTWESGATPVIVLSKTDLAGDDVGAVRAAIEAVAPGLPVIRLSSVTGEGVAEAGRMIRPGITAALLGSSGVGKSTLVNALLGDERQRTGTVRADGRGRHTTTHRELVPLPTGGLLLDTPGMRELQLVQVDAGAVAATYPDIEGLARVCRFADCRHDAEPGCAVHAAVAAGELDAERLDGYHRIMAELRHIDARFDARARMENRRSDRIANRALRQHLRRKYDG